ncbi:hypothetical protein J7643_06010 [bacterium]|nr:hypothetical protein [bacterium]
MSQEKTLEQLQAELVTALMQDEALKAEFIANPNEVASRVLGIQIPSFIKLMPVEIPANAILVPLPAKMSEDELSDLDLELVAGGKSTAERVVYDLLPFDLKMLGKSFASVGDALKNPQDFANHFKNTVGSLFK